MTSHGGMQGWDHNDVGRGATARETPNVARGRDLGVPPLVEAMAVVHTNRPRDRLGDPVAGMSDEQPLPMDMIRWERYCEQEE